LAAPACRSRRPATHGRHSQPRRRDPQGDGCTVCALRAPSRMVKLWPRTREASESRTGRADRVGCDRAVGRAALPAVPGSRA
jgi:hypothetical protein